MYYTSQRATRFDPSVIGGDALFLSASAVIFVLLFPWFLHCTNQLICIEIILDKLLFYLSGKFQTAKKHLNFVSVFHKQKNECASSQ